MNWQGFGKKMFLNGDLVSLFVMYLGRWRQMVETHSSQKKMTSMYIDLVEQKFALNSCAPLDERYNCKDFNNDVNKMFSFLLKRLDK